MRRALGGLTTGILPLGVSLLEASGVASTSSAPHFGGESWIEVTAVP